MEHRAIEDKAKKIFSTYFDNTNLCASEVFKRSQGDDRDSYLKQLESAVCDVAKIEYVVQKEAEVFRSMENELSKSTDCEWGNLSEMLSQRLTDTAPKDITKTRRYKDYQSHLESLQSSLELESMIVQTSENTIDPYSKKPIEHPVRTKYCNHVFDKTSVMEVLAAKAGNKLRCPYVGCQKWFTKNDLVDASEENSASEEDE